MKNLIEKLTDDIIKNTTVKDLEYVKVILGKIRDKRPKISNYVNKCLNEIKL